MSIMTFFECVAKCGTLFFMPCDLDHGLIRCLKSIIGYRQRALHKFVHAHEKTPFEKKQLVSSTYKLKYICGGPGARSGGVGISCYGHAGCSSCSDFSELVGRCNCS